MPITINGSGTVTGISAGGLPDGCITTDDIAANAVTYAKIGTTEQGQLCKAWVNFNGTGTVAIRASYNVSSITDRGVGNYTVNFANSLPDGSYSTVINAGGGFSNYFAVRQRSQLKLRWVFINVYNYCRNKICCRQSKTFCPERCGHDYCRRFPLTVMNRIIYQTEDGGVAVIIPTESVELALKDVPEGVAYEIIS
jgi:hypothetical protein